MAAQGNERMLRIHRKENNAEAIRWSCNLPFGPERSRSPKEKNQIPRWHGDTPSKLSRLGFFPTRQLKHSIVPGETFALKQCPTACVCVWHSSSAMPNDIETSTIHDMLSMLHIQVCRTHWTTTFFSWHALIIFDMSHSVDLNSSTYIYIYIYMYIYIYTYNIVYHTYTYIYIYVYTYINTYIYISLISCWCVNDWLIILEISGSHHALRLRRAPCLFPPAAPAEDARGRPWRSWRSWGARWPSKQGALAVLG